ncbi:hypothetical protein [Pseudaquabacterium rugosum]|uniref:NHL repeat-containing protein n=1 Tax=Pseudaquabacterium rugosum TaxID=2984194 RepID=A0ABU9BD36_9BURK
MAIDRLWRLAAATTRATQGTAMREAAGRAEAGPALLRRRLPDEEGAAVGGAWPLDLATADDAAGSGPAAPRALAPHAQVMLGSAGDGSFRPAVRPGACRLQYPRGVACTTDGALWVADSGHHRLLGWARVPQADHAPADWVIGQPDLDAEARNRGGAVRPSSLNAPHGLCACDDGLAVADAWNHRVLLWRRAPTRSDVPPDVILGQADGAAGLPQGGRAQPDAAGMNLPAGVHWDGARLWVADSGNGRLLVWDGLPHRDGQPADRVLVIGGRPVALAHWRHHLVVADADGHRLLLWGGEPLRDDEAPRGCFGQDLAAAPPLRPNRGEVASAADRLWSPQALMCLPGVDSGLLRGVNDALLVADSGNSRLLRIDAPWHDEASALVGQTHWRERGDNRWQFASRDSLNQPQGLAWTGDAVVVADSGNHRVLVWPVD